MTRPRWAATWWLRGLARGSSGPRFGPLAEWARGLRPRGAAICGRLPGTPRSAVAMNPSTAGTLSAGASHGSRGGLAPHRQAWERAAVGICERVPETCAPDAPLPSGMGNARELSSLACALGRMGQAARSTVPSPALWPGRTWSWAKVSCRGAGGEVASFPCSSRLPVASQRVSDAARARVLGPTPSEGPCLASRLVPDGNVHWACGRAFQDPCLGGARHVGAQGGRDLPSRREPAHVGSELLDECSLPQGRGPRSPLVVDTPMPWVGMGPAFSGRVSWPSAGHENRLPRGVLPGPAGPCG